MAFSEDIKSIKQNSVNGYPAIFLTVFVTLFFLLLFFPSHILAQSNVTTYFKGSEYELDVYRIKGRNAGPTVMIIGGIHGDEPGGYLTADKFVDITLEQGSLIVVPRANFQTIIQNRRYLFGDMNRLFSEDEERFEGDHSVKIVKILKELMAESDLLLNLHDGYGFYRPNYVSEMYNPLRLGQTIITDADEYTSPDGVVLKLGDTAQRIVQEVNSRIENTEHHFRYLNHNTFDRNTQNEEMKLSATFYAVSKHTVPAFGIETSKNIRDNNLKVRYQNLVVDAFMAEFGLIRDPVNSSVPVPELKFLAISVNGKLTVQYPHNSTIHVHSGDKITVKHIETNYGRGLSVDIAGYGNLHDFEKEIEIFQNTTISVKKDGFTAGSVNVLVSEAANGASNGENGNGYIEPKVNYFTVEVNGFVQNVPEKGTLSIVRGDIIKVINSSPSVNAFPGAVLNMWGYVSKKRRGNEGDDANELIDTAKEFIPVWSYNGEGKEYQLRLQRSDDDVISSIIIRLNEPRLHSLVLQFDNGNKGYLEVNDTYILTEEKQLEIASLSTNVINNEGIRVKIAGLSARTDGNRLNMLLDVQKDLLPAYTVGQSGETFAIEVFYRDKSIGKAFLRVRRPN